MDTIKQAKSLLLGSDEDELIISGVLPGCGTCVLCEDKHWCIKHKIEVDFDDVCNFYRKNDVR